MYCEKARGIIAFAYGEEAGMERDELREELMTAYELIRGLTEQVADLTILLTPLIRALDEKHDTLPLRDAFLEEQKGIVHELLQLKADSIDAVDHAIQRVRGL